MKRQSNIPKSTRKLSLNKKTISNLTSDEMKKKLGGGPTKGKTCAFTCGYTCGNRTCYIYCGW